MVAGTNYLTYQEETAIRIYLEGPYYIILALFWLVVLATLRFRYKHSYSYLFFLSVSYIYLIGLIKVTQFPLTFISGHDSMGSVIQSINWVPFKRMNEDYENAVLNIILTLPIGLILPFIKKVTTKSILTWSIVLPLLIEGLQFMMSLITLNSERRLDINDLMTNFLGVWAGYIIFLLFIRWYRSAIHKTNIPLNPFLHYIYNRKNNHT